MKFNCYTVDNDSYIMWEKEQVEQEVVMCYDQQYLSHVYIQILMYIASLGDTKHSRIGRVRNNLRFVCTQAKQWFQSIS